MGFVGVFSCYLASISTYVGTLLSIDINLQKKS